MIRLPLCDCLDFETLLYPKIGVWTGLITSAPGHNYGDYVWRFGHNSPKKRWGLCLIPQKENNGYVEFRGYPLSNNLKILWQIPTKIINFRKTIDRAAGVGHIQKDKDILVFYSIQVFKNCHRNFNWAQRFLTTFPSFGYITCTYNQVV